jgi:hypothetical protein
MIVLSVKGVPARVNNFISTASQLVRISGQAFGQRHYDCTKANLQQLTEQPIK